MTVRYLLVAVGRMLVFLIISAVCLSMLLRMYANWIETPPALQYIFSILNGSLLFDESVKSVDWGKHFYDFARSGLIVLIAFVWSTALSLILGYRLARKPHSKLWDYCSDLATFVSGVPFLVAGLLAWYYLGGYRGTLPRSHLVIAGILLGTCEGALAEWPRYFRGIFDDLQKKTYYLAYLARGQRTSGLIWRYVGPYLTQTLPTRISYLFGGLIVIEEALGIRALGHSFINCLNNPGGSFAYREAMIAALLIVLVPITVRAFLVPHSGERRTLLVKGGPQ
jgi:ABC-type dipeptide/oligopeptide/nickel transport system permease component